MSLPSHLPQGDYPKPSAVHYLDLETTADKLLEELPGHGRRSRTLAREGGASLVLMAMEAGDSVAEHSADGAVSIQVLRGQVTLTANGQAQALRAGEAAFMQPGVRHDLTAEEQTVVLISISPPGK